MNKSQKARMDRLVNELNTLLEEVRKVHPNANWYLEDSGNLNLMSDESHDSSGRARKDHVLHHSNLKNAGGGGW